MTKGNIAWALLLIVFLFTAGCGLSAAPAETSPSPTPSAGETAPAPAPSPTPETDPVAEAVAALTLEQKVGQLLVAGVESTQPGEDGETAVADYQVGGIILFGRNVADGAQLAELTNELKALNAGGVPLLLCVDEEGGRVSRMPGEVTDLPAALAYGRTGDEALLHDLGGVLGAECAAFGFNLDFAPVLDVWSNPDNTVIGDRAYAADPEQAADAALQVAAGLEEAGIIPVGKHFPGHGDTDTDSHLALPVVDKTREEWEALEAIPFRRAVEAGIPAVMVGHILMSQFDSQYPASLSPVLVDGVLRGELGFEGVVCTDDLTMAAISDSYGMGEAAVLAVEAGCDLLLVCHGSDNLTAARDALLAAAESGRLSMERLDESVYRILRLKEDFGLADTPVDAPDVEGLNARIAALLNK